MYFLDKSTLIKHLSPEKSLSKGRYPAEKGLGDKALSDIEGEETSKKIEPSLLVKNFNNLNHALNLSDIPAKQLLKSKKIVIGQAQTKVFAKGVDQIIKENLKKSKHKEEEEVLKKYLEEFRQRKKKVELSQRNQEVRKINASKIIYNHQHKNS